METKKNHNKAITTKFTKKETNLTDNPPFKFSDVICDRHADRQAHN